MNAPFENKGDALRKILKWLQRKHRQETLENKEVDYLHDVEDVVG